VRTRLFLCATFFVGAFRSFFRGWRRDHPILKSLFLSFLMTRHLYVAAFVFFAKSQFVGSTSRMARGLTSSNELRRRFVDSHLHGQNPPGDAVIGIRCSYLVLPSVLLRARKVRILLTRSVFAQTRCALFNLSSGPALRFCS